MICGMCTYWYHKTCAGISDEVFKCIEAHCKDNATFWNCTPCSSYARGITARMRELEGRVEVVERRQSEQEDEIQNINKKIDGTNQAVKKLEQRIETEKAGSSVFQELRERNARRLNVIFYGVGECNSVDMEERRNWDRASCVNIFKALKLSLNARSIRYVRRIGEKGNKPRPLLAGMLCTGDKDLLLENAKYLRDTN